METTRRNHSGSASGLSVLSLAVAMALGTALPVRANADELTDLKSELESAKRSIEALEKKINQLEAERSTAAGAAPAVAATETTGAATTETIEPDSHKQAPTEGEGPRLDLYGFIMLDAIYDFDKVDPAWEDTLRPSRIPVNCPGDGGCGADGNMIFSVRQTRFGIKGFVPTGLGELTTILEFELFGVGDDEGQTTPRLRHAWAELGQLGAGQTWSAFMDPAVFPNTIDYWGPSGMIFLRNPQIRWTPIRDDNRELAIALESPGSALDTGKLQEIDPSLDVDPRTVFPDLSAHWRTTGDWGHFQLAGILRSVGWEVASNPKGEPNGEELGWGLNASAVLNFFDKDALRMQLAYGEGIASYINDGGSDLGPDNNFRPEVLPLLGWLVYYDHYWSDQWSTSLGWSMVDQDNSRNQSDDAFHQSQYGNLNLLYYPTNDVMIGGELVHGKLEHKDGSSATDTRLQMSLKYYFD